MKKRLMLLPACLCVFALAACTKTPAGTDTPTDPEEAKPTAVNSPGSDETPVVYYDELNSAEIFEGIYSSGRAFIAISADGPDKANISVTWGNNAWDTTCWDMTGTFDEESLSLKYSDCVKKNVVTGDDGSNTETVVYEGGTGRIVFMPDYSLFWEDDKENMGADMPFYQDYNAEAAMANPWIVITEADACAYCPTLFKLPEEAEDVIWTYNQSMGDQTKFGLVEADFTVDGIPYTARAQYGAAEDDQIDGLYYNWDSESDILLESWGANGKVCSANADGSTIKLLSWYVTGSCTAYSLSAEGAGADVEKIAGEMVR